ncbi:unnamed protein product [Blepharisma stoltei]|uniref:Uncharacterized protein n=1 Tax=Blepharisma stoltei TaxID=1481888 RepID=A0AAU9IT40_9CILI|nr:unnamed protein product [Blepharisma stoltei]
MLHNFGGGEEQALTARSQGAFSSITRDSKYRGKYKSVNPRSRTLQEKLESELYKLNGCTDFSFAPTLCEKSVKIHTSNMRSQTVDRFVQKEHKNKKQFKVKSWIFQPTIGTLRQRQSMFIQKSLPMSVDVRINENEMGRSVKKFEITKSFSVDKSLVSKDESDFLSRSLDDVSKELGRRPNEIVDFDKANGKIQEKIEEEKEAEVEVEKKPNEIIENHINRAQEEKVELEKIEEKVETKEKEENKKEESKKIVEEVKEDGQVLKSKSLSKISFSAKDKKLKDTRTVQKSKTIAMKADNKLKKAAKDELKVNKEETKPAEVPQIPPEIAPADAKVQEKKVDFKIADTEPKAEDKQPKGKAAPELREIKEDLKEEKPHEENEADKTAESKTKRSPKKIAKSKTVKPRSGSIKSSKEGQSSESTPKNDIEESKIGKKVGIKIQNIGEYEKLGKSQSLSNISDLTTGRTSIPEKQAEPNNEIVKNKEELHANTDEIIMVKSLDLIRAQSESAEIKQEKESTLKKTLNTATEEKKKTRGEAKHSSLVSTQKTTKTIKKSKSNEKITTKKEINAEAEQNPEPKVEEKKEELIATVKQEPVATKEEVKIEAAPINPEEEKQDKPAPKKKRKSNSSSTIEEQPKEEQKSKKTPKLKHKTVPKSPEPESAKEEKNEATSLKSKDDTKVLPKEEKKTNHKKGKSIGQPIAEEKKIETPQEVPKKIEEEKTTPWSQQVDEGNGETVEEETKLVKQKSTKKIEETKAKAPNKAAGKKLNVKATVKGVTKIIHFSSTDSAEDVVKEFTEKNELSKKDRENLLKDITQQLKKK